MSYRYVALSGARIAYRAHGSGPAVVLMKNNRRPLDYPVAELLSRRFRVLQIHPIGFGAGDRPDNYEFRRLRPVLEGIGFRYVEFEGLNHGTCGLGDASADGRRVAQDVADYLISRGR